MAAVGVASLYVAKQYNHKEVLPSESAPIIGKPKLSAPSDSDLEPAHVVLIEDGVMMGGQIVVLAEVVKMTRRRLRVSPQ